ncbi:MAG: hypothetical protein C4518_11420 [Desulfobacteraceae bacterium]|nr:MAG: hypothetical protein C4518_11420 [Desulfobacteraceae bacterium]
MNDVINFKRFWVILIVPFQSLKFKIAANLAIIIMITTLLSYLVIIHIVQKNLIHTGVEQGKRLLTGLPEPDGTNIGRWTGALDILLKNTPFISADFHSITGEEYHYGLVPDDLKHALRQQTSQVLQTGQPHIQFYGDIWSLFWHQSRYVLISDLIKGPGGQLSGAKTIIIELDGIYLALRQSQKIIIWYMTANFFILLFLGTYRLSRLLIRPIHKFIKMTDDYRDKDRLYFSPGRKYQEFNQLSKALNQMIEKIEKNKENLQDAFNQLEQANKELKNAQEDIVKAEKLASIGRLSAGIAHEIGNPIGIVLGYIDLLKARPMLKADDTAQDYLLRAADEIQRVHGIIRQLLDFSRAAPLNLQYIEIHDLVKEVAAVMSHQPLMGDIDIECRLTATGDRIFADYDQIRQVLVNLMINAADAISGSTNASKGKIILETQSVTAADKEALAGHPTLILRVADNGTGISKQDIENIFDPFFTTKEPGKGTGLGLSVSYMIIEQAGGTITAESGTGQGTTIIISFPLSTEIPEV